jgi:hypothetical protein
MAARGRAAGRAGGGRADAAPPLRAAGPAGRAGRVRPRRRRTPRCRRDDLDDNPTVYASRYGETGRCLELLADQARGDALSPTAFGLSVHNAIGAMIALARGDRRNSSAIAAGRATAAAGVVEAMALLEDGAHGASLVVYDSPLPAGYAQFEDEPSAHFAWAWRLRRPRAGERALHLDWQAANTDDDAPHPQLPASLQALWFGLSDAPSSCSRPTAAAASGAAMRETAAIATPRAARC